MVLAQIFAAFAIAGGTILERLILMKKSIKVTQYQFLVFLTIVLVMSPFIFFFWKMDQAALELKNILILLLVVGFSVIANYFAFISMKKERPSKLLPARMMEPLFIVFLTFLFSYLISPIYERNFIVIIPTLIAGLALIFSHIKKHHLEFNKSFVYAIVGSFFFALEMVVSFLILDYYSSITFYFVRCVLILIATTIIFRPNTINGLDKKTSIKIFAASILWVIVRMAVYSGYMTIGILQTTLMVMLGPVLIYYFSWIFLKDKPGWKNLVSSGVIVICILYVAIFQ